MNLRENLCSHAVLRMLSLFCALLSTQKSGFSQPATRHIAHQQAVFRDTFPDFQITYDTILWQYQATCKSLATALHLLPDTNWMVKPTTTVLKRPDSTSVIKHIPLLTIHGNVQYNYLYRSFVDTPFSQNDFQQHSIQTALHVVIKDKYPLNINLSQRISNSPYFKNLLDLNARFDRYAYLKTIRQQLLDRLALNQLKRPDLANAEKALKDLIDKYNALKAMLNGKDALQRIVEARERELFKSQNSKNPIPALPSLPSIPDKAAIKQRLYKAGEKLKDEHTSPRQPDSSYSLFIEKKKKELDSLEQSVHKLQNKADSLRNAVNKTLISVNQKIYKATSLQELKKIETENELETEKPKGIERFLSNVKSIGIGRSVVNYSELTAWNVSLTGLNMEYTPGSMYTALAVGKIDYGFRDFMNKNSRQKGQNFIMGRLGIGDPEHKAVIVSTFAGKKYQYGTLVTDSISNYVNLLGYSVEAIYRKDEHTSISAEIAKTTRPVSGSARTGNDMKSLWQFGDNANLGLSIKGQTLLKGTGTQLSGFYRKTGESFQSFSLFTYNTDQTAWSLKAEQPFFNNKVSLIGALRRNDFINPFTEKTFKTSTVFKSIQVNVRVPQWPVLSFGYYPGTQLYVVDKERIRENAYYIINGSLLYNYKAGNTRMLSSLIYNQYAGKGTDSGFIAYNGASYMASQTILFGKAQLQGLYMFTDQEQMQFYSLEANADYSLRKWLRAGAGIKYNRVSGGSSYTGSRATLGIDIPKLGSLQLQYEKSYLPTIYQTLYPIKTGNVSWYKYF